ncbi:MAG: TonB-dependent copper receptor [Pseudomonadota bacterium]
MSAFVRKSLFVSLSLALMSFSHASSGAENASLDAPVDGHADAETIVITGSRMSEPLTVHTDTKKPRQPLPAHDGADYLKTIAGFAVTRKSGTDGDPLFRGMAGSRLGILVDGGNILGGCNARMDAPTAYIFPELYDRLSVIKGPQTVLSGPGVSAGAVRFERDTSAFTEADQKTYAGLVAGSFGRFDAIADLRFGNASGYAQITGSYSESDDYEDGDGERVHAAYERYNGNLAFGWTPDENTLLEASIGQSDGEAAYADRAMDGSKFLRESESLRFRRSDFTAWFTRLDINLYRNDVDHVMDDQTLRTPGMMGYSNLLRQTEGGRAVATFNPTANTQLDAGIDGERNSHRSRSAAPMASYSLWRDDARFEQTGLFVELAYQHDNAHRYIAGLRRDNWWVKDERASTGGMMPMPNPSFGATRDEDLQSGFLRYEYRAAHNTWFVGLGHSERFPDYWELIAKESASSRSAFETKPETTRQLDVGVIHQAEALQLSVSLFANRIDDYILIDFSNPMKRSGFARNIDASSWGGEIEASYRLSEHWQTTGSLAYVRGDNDSDDVPLAQLPPLDARIGLQYDAGKWSVGSLLRMVDQQDRYALNQGNIVGRDLGESAGFAVFSLNGSWRPAEDWLLSAGIDNLFDKTYAEFVSRAGGNGMGGSIPGYVQTTRVNEPGRLLWLKATLQF